MKLARFAFGFALGTLISRLLGFLRDASVAYYFGASYVSDAFFIAFRIPNSFRRLLGEGGFNAVFVPLYTRALEEGRGREFLAKLFTFYLLMNCSITFAGVFLSEFIVYAIAPGIRDEGSFSLAVFMARFLFLYLLLVGLNAFFMGVLNVKGRFFIPAVSQGVFNGVFLVCLLLLAERYGYVALVAGVLVGGIFQTAINIPFLIRDRVRLGISLRFDNDVKETLRRLIPALGGFGVNQLSLFIDTFLASFLGKGAVSYLYYANRLYQLPFGVVSVGVANSLLTLISKKDSDRRRELTDALRIIVILMLPASAGLVLLSQEIVSLVYHRGSFRVEDVLISAKILSIYSLGLVPFSVQKSLSAVFFSRGDTKTPVVASLLTIIAEGFFAYLLAFSVGLGILGLPGGTALSSLIGLVFLWHRMDIRPYMTVLLNSLWKSALATLLMSVFLLYIKNYALTAHTTVALSLLVSPPVYFLSLALLREGLVLRLGKGLVKKFVNSGDPS